MPNEANGYNNRADYYLQIGNLEKALSDINTAIQLDKNYAPGYATRAEIYLKLNKKDKARKDVKKAIKLGLMTDDIFNLLDKCD